MCATCPAHPTLLDLDVVAGNFTAFEIYNNGFIGTNN
jgi:hypothetical protein